MLYSIGKDSAVMLHLAMKAFYPGEAAVSAAARRHDVEVQGDVRVPRPDGARSSASSCSCTRTPKRSRRASIRSRTARRVHTDVWKTEGLKQALDKYGFDAAFGGARRDEEKSRAKERVFSFRSAQHRWDPKNQRPELWRLYNAQQAARRDDPRVPAVELDRARRLAVHLPRGHPDRAALLRRASGRSSSATAR